MNKEEKEEETLQQIYTNLEKEFKDKKVSIENKIRFLGTLAEQRIEECVVNSDEIVATPFLVITLKNTATFIQAGVTIMELYLKRKEHMSKKNKSENNKENKDAPTI